MVTPHKKLTPTFFRCVLKMGVSSKFSFFVSEIVARANFLSQSLHKFLHITSELFAVMVLSFSRKNFCQY